MTHSWPWCVVHDRGPFSSPAWKTRSPPRGGSAFSPFPTPTACKFGARPASPIQYGRRRILKNPFWSAQNRTGGSVYFCAQGTCLAPIHWTSGADRRRVARCGFMSSFGSLYCRSLTWCLALLISRQSLMCGGPRRSRVFSRNERRRAQGAAIVWLFGGSLACQVGARKAVRMLSPERPNDSTHGLGGFRERPPSAIVHAVVTMA